MAGRIGVGVKKLAKRSGLEAYQVSALIEAIRRAIADGERVQLTGLGSLERRKIAPREFTVSEVGNLVSQPSGQDAKIVKGERFSVAFKPSKSFRDDLTAGVYAIQDLGDEQGV